MMPALPAAPMVVNAIMVAVMIIPTLTTLHRMRMKKPARMPVGNLIMEKTVRATVIVNQVIVVVAGLTEMLRAGQLFALRLWLRRIRREMVNHAPIVT
jgi:hypothetical protein